MMLARNWLTAKELGIKERTRDLLVEVLYYMETGKIGAKEFNMGTFGLIGIDGATVEPCCIGGHMRKVAYEKGERVAAYGFAGQNDIANWLGDNDYWKLHALFYPSVEEHGWAALFAQATRITVDDAREVIDKYLQTGKISWSKAMCRILGCTHFREMAEYPRVSVPDIFRCGELPQGIVVRREGLVVMDGVN